jgi:pyruvate dehydrogenase kinase 2/3/4
MDTIKHYSSFPATGVSLRQMVQFGEKPSTGTVTVADRLTAEVRACAIVMDDVGTLFRASHLFRRAPNTLSPPCARARDLPDSLNEMPSIKKVQDWYAQSFEVCRSSHTVSAVGSAQAPALICDAGNHQAPKTQSATRSKERLMKPAKHSNRESKSSARPHRIQV